MPKIFERQSPRLLPEAPFKHLSAAEARRTKKDRRPADVCSPCGRAAPRAAQVDGAADQHLMNDENADDSLAPRCRGLCAAKSRSAGRCARGRARGVDLRDDGVEDRSVIDLLLSAVAAFTRFFAPRAVVAAENLLLRHQLTVLRRSSRRPRLRRLDRWLIASLATRTRLLLDAVIVVKPATVLRWHRAAWRLWWRFRSRRPIGRPPIDPELRGLIRRMWRENRLWGENRIAGELAKLGWRVSPRTVAKYRPKLLGRGRGQSWSTFLRNHASQIWACDFFTVVTVHFQTLYAFVVTSLDRREIVHVGVTAHPTGVWVAQRMVEAVGDAPPRYLLHDRDCIYDARFRVRLRGLGVRRLLSPPRAPTANAICERLVGTLRRDLDHVLVFSERHAERILREYVRYYHGRPHRSLRAQPPAGARWLAPKQPAKSHDLTATPVLGGLHHRYAFPSARSSPPTLIEFLRRTALNSASIGGRPIRPLERQRHQSRHAARCHRRTVAGRTTITASSSERVRVASVAISHRSSRRNRGRRDERRSTTSWWRSSRFSAATTARGAKSLRTAATTFRRRSSTERSSTRGLAGPAASRPCALRSMRTEFLRRTASPTPLRQPGKAVTTPSRPFLRIPKR
jgi:putative transposase